MLASSIWPSARERLEKEVSKQQFSTWIQPLTLIESEAGCLRLLAPNRFVMQWVRDRFASRIEVLASELAGVPVQLVVDLAVTGPVAANAVVNGEDVDTPSPASKPAPTSAVPALKTGRTSGERGSLLNSFTFDTFVAGKANQLARAAAIQVAEHPGTSYNPLFIYGGVGLGKTHLIQAVGNAVLAQNPSARVRYLHAAQYISDVIRAYQQKSFDEFKRYYHSLDLLLIDDIQFFASKDRTQEEFFYAFNALIEAQKQVIITSDTYPKDMAGIDERLKSRFSWGLTVAIEPPEQEMRVAIILRKAVASGMDLPEEVAFLIAQHVRSNVRELEGALKSVLAFATFSGKAITLETSKEALKDVLSMSNRQISIDNIQKTTADFYKIKISDMHSKKRSRNIARPRQVAMALAKELTMMSLPDIGEAFGNRDHTTVLHACRTIATLRGADQQLNRDFLVLEQILKG